jgi:hypothetical protein
MVKIKGFGQPGGREISAAADPLEMRVREVYFPMVGESALAHQPAEPTERKWGTYKLNAVSVRAS